jgi:four helix bundle protein
MSFAFEGLLVYQQSLDFSAAVIDVIAAVDTPRKHYKLIEQLEACCASICLNIAEGKGRFSKKEFKQFLYSSGA